MQSRTDGSMEVSAIYEDVGAQTRRQGLNGTLDENIRGTTMYQLSGFESRLSLKIAYVK